MTTQSQQREETEKDEVAYQDETLVDDVSKHAVGSGTSAENAALTRKILFKLDIRYMMSKCAS